MSRLLPVSFLILVLTTVWGCSPQQSAWKKAREADTPESYEQFLKHYPNGDFSAQAQARLKDLYTERDWQTARDADTPDAYQTFLKGHPEGKDADEARRRIEDFNAAQTPGTTSASAGPAAAGEAPPAAGAGANGPTAAAAPSTSVPAAPAPSAPAPAKEPRAATAGAGSAQSSGAGAQRAAGAAARPSSKHLARTAPATGYRLQLGAFRKGGERAANRHWAALKKRYPALLKGLSPKVVATHSKSGTLYRLQVAGVSEQRARHICQSLKAQSQACVVVRPAHG